MAAKLKHRDFKQAIVWIVKDIQREILLAYAGKDAGHKADLARIGIPDGGGNTGDVTDARRGGLDSSLFDHPNTRMPSSAAR
jgi:hypothetical protein